MNRFTPLLLLALAACATAPDPTVPVQYYAQWSRITAHAPEGSFPKFDSLEAANTFVNKVPFKPDLENYGVRDHWASPTEFFKRGGDCEDYVIAKYVSVTQSGLVTPGEARMYLVADRYRGGSPHAVLVVRGRVLDNQNKEILSVDDQEVQMRYKFLVEVK